MSGARPSSRAERAARTRGAIVAAAAGAIAENGVRGMRVEDVAARAGVSTALLYYHYDDRPTLLRAALEQANARAPSGALRDHRRDDMTARAAVTDALLNEFDARPSVRNDAIVWNEVAATAVFEPELRDGLRRVTGEWNGWVADALAAGVADGSIRAGLDPAETAELLTALVEGLSQRWLAGTLEQECARALCHAALDALLSP